VAQSSTAQSSQDTDPAGVPVSPNSPLDFDTLYREEIGFVWRCLRGLGVDTAALADAAQEVFVIVHRRFADALQ
jgi:RNA polymerase sigma-70 factor (ECF subfamily)